MNGVRIASSDQLAGTWRVFQFDVTAAAKPGEMNSLAVEVFPPQPRDLAITLVDWAPMPPDKEMGIWRDVRITATGPITLRYPTVLTKLNLPSANEALLTVRAELNNTTGHPVEGVLKGHIENVTFDQPVRLEPRQTQLVQFTPDKFSQLKLANPRLWWPAQVGKQELYPLDLSLEVGGQVSD
jgi:exo-1,4-beta-D-glucosaminidase